MKDQRIRIGMDIGGTTVKTGLVDWDNHLIDTLETPTGTGRPVSEMIEDMASAVKKLLSSNGYTLEQCVGMGIAMPGTVDTKSGDVLYSNNFDWEEVPLTSELQKRLPIPMKIANDADCAALGEVAAGAAKGCMDALMITLGTGVGGGVIIDGKLFAGKLRGGTELGHTVLVMDGVRCTCGRKGCVESYVSATGLLREGREKMKMQPRSLLWQMTEGSEASLGTKMIFDAAKQGDETAVEIVLQYQKYLTAALANYINIFRPEIVVVGGGLSRQEDYLLAPVNAALREECFGKEHGQVPKVVPAQLLNDAGMIGAANLLQEQQ